MNKIFFTAIKIPLLMLIVLPMKVQAQTIYVPYAPVDNGPNIIDEVNMAPSGATVVIQNNGFVWNTGPIEIENKNDVTLKLEDGVRLRAIDGLNQFQNLEHTKLFTLKNCQNFTLTGYGAKFEMNKSVYTNLTMNHQFKHCLALVKCKNVEVKGLTFEGAPGDGIWLGHNNQLGGVNEDIVIEDVTCHRNGRNGIAVIAGDGVDILNCALTETGVGNLSHQIQGPWAGIDIEPVERDIYGYGGCYYDEVLKEWICPVEYTYLDSYAKDILIQDCDIESNIKDGITMSFNGHLDTRDVGYIKILDTDIGNSWRGISLSGRVRTANTGSIAIERVDMDYIQKIGFKITDWISTSTMPTYIKDVEIFSTHLPPNWPIKFRFRDPSHNKMIGSITVQNMKIYGPVPNKSLVGYNEQPSVPGTPINYHLKDISLDLLTDECTSFIDPPPPGHTLTNVTNNVTYLVSCKTGGSGQSTTGEGEETEDLQSLVLYPNPGEDVVHLSSPELIRSVEVFDSQGSLVLQIDEPTDIDISALPPGIYNFRLISTGDKLINRRLVKH